MMLKRSLFTFYTLQQRIWNRKCQVRINTAICLRVFFSISALKMYLNRPQARVLEIFNKSLFIGHPVTYSSFSVTCILRSSANCPSPNRLTNHMQNTRVHFISTFTFNILASLCVARVV